MTDEKFADARKQSEAAAQWLNSPEGEQALKEALDRCHRANENLRKARTVSWEDMHRPCTI